MKLITRQHTGYRNVRIAPDACGSVPAMFGFLLFGMKIPLSLFFSFALFPCPHLSRKFSRLLCKLHGLLGFGADALLSRAGNLALPALRIGRDGLNLYSFHRRRETELQIILQDKFMYLLLFRFCSEYHTGNAQRPALGSFEDSDSELAVKENRQCNAWHYSSSRSASRFMEQRTTHEREGYLRFPAPDYQPACVFLLRADRSIISYPAKKGPDRCERCVLSMWSKHQTVSTTARPFDFKSWRVFRVRTFSLQGYVFG